MKILKYIFLVLPLVAFDTNTPPSLEKVENLEPGVFQRVVLAQIYRNKNWTLEGEDAVSVGKVLADLKPTYVSGLLQLDASYDLSPEQIKRYKKVREMVKAVNPNCKFDFIINPRQFKKPEDILKRMRDIQAKIPVDIWYLDFAEGEYNSSKVVQAAIAAAHENKQLIGGNFQDSNLLKMGDFVAFSDNEKVDIKLKEEILKTGEKFGKPILFQINNDTNRSADDTVHTFIRKWKTYERERYVKRLSRNQLSWKYRLMYPVFFPVYLRKEAYNAAKDNEILKSYLEVMALYNELE